ncbi:MAG TPA: carbon monoxide dehydrogenase subunit G [Chloroflexota bacterium]
MPMTFQGTVTIGAPRAEVYAFLTDPTRVTRCAPDVQRVEVVDDDSFKVTVRVGVGPVRATFALEVTWLERAAPESARARAKGTAPGSAVNLTALMELSEVAEGTRLDWRTEVVVAGTIASVGARLLQGTADRIAAQVFACVKQTLEAPAASVR